MTKNPIEQLNSEFEINDAPLSARNLLTRGHVQDEITQISGCAVTTRGRYMTPVERLKNPNERALYLFIQGPNKASLDLAIQKIDEIIRTEQMSGNTKFRSNTHYSAAPTVTSVEKVYVGIENCSPGFDLRGKLIGVRGTNLNYIRNETGAIVTLRGKGSLFIDPNLGTESSEPLHLYIEHSNREGLNVAKQLALNLIETLQQEVAQSQPQVIIQPQTQQLQIYPNQNQLGMYPGQQSNIMNFKPNAPPPQLNIPPPGVHIPPQQGPLVSQPPPQMNQLGTQQMLLNNSDAQSNNMIITSTPQIVTSVANSQGTQSVYGNHNQQIHQIQQQTQPQLTIQQQPYQQQLFSTNRQNQNTVNSINQYSTTVQNDQTNIQDNIATQYQMQSANLQQNTGQIVGLNNVTQLIPNHQVQGGQTSVPMQIVQTGQPLHILSPQGLTMQNQHFVQPQIQMNSLQTQPNTLQQINTIQVPTSAPGQVAFQIPIQTQGGASAQFLQQQNIQQASVLLAQQNLQPQTNLQTITSMPGTQFQLQQQPFQHQIPILPNVQPQAHTSQYVTAQGQMGVYTTQGLVLVQSNQNLQLSGTNVQSVSNFNPQIVSSNQQDLNQSIQTMPVQMNLPPPNVQQLTATVNVQQQNAAEQQKSEQQNIVLEQVATNPNNGTNDNVQISNIQNTLQRCQTIQSTLNVTQDSVNQQIISANVTGQTLQIQQIDPSTVVASDATHAASASTISQNNQLQQSTNQIPQMQTVSNYPFQQTSLPQHMQEQKNVPSYLLMQPLHQTSENSNLLNSNQVVLPSPHNQNQSQITFPNPQTQTVTNTPAQTIPTSQQQESSINIQQCNVSNPNQQDQFSASSDVSQQQQQQQQQIQSQQNTQQLQKSLEQKQQSNVDESPQSRKRKLSDTIDNSEAESQTLKKSGVGIDQSQTGKCSTTSNYNQKGNLTQTSQSNSGSSPGNQKNTEKDKCNPMENQMQFAAARANVMWRNEQQQEFTRVLPNPDNSNRHNEQSSAHLTKKINETQQATPYHPQSTNMLPTGDNWQTNTSPGPNMSTQWNQSPSENYMNETHGAAPRHTSLLPGRQININSQSPAMRPSNFNSPKYQYATNPSSSMPSYRTSYLIPRNQYIQSRRENQNYQYQPTNANYMQNNPRSQQGNWFPSQGGGGGWM